MDKWQDDREYPSWIPSTTALFGRKELSMSVTYWRMQLHPSEPARAAHYAHNSLAAGFIGLDFDSDIGDLMVTSQHSLPPKQRDYWAFAHEMKIDDRVLVIAHHFPVALVTVDGEYNYVRAPDPRLGVWFRHFRRVRDVRYYADRVTNAPDWENLVMTDTISPLRNPNSASYRLIDTWA